jgi:triphosphatase
MATEIELKYLLDNHQVEQNITQLLDNLAFPYQLAKKHLSNSYFDTKDLAFRQYDFGLRVRSQDEHREQTIKTAGQVIGGLHKRPEYNVTIKSNFPNLSLFPENIWPEEHIHKQWQDQLIVLFTTDFVRTTWNITLADSSEVELAFDLGKISAVGNNVDICEIELELISGNVSSLFSLADQLMNVLSMRPGIRSKAARGYQLRKGPANLATFDDFPLIQCSQECSAYQAFVSGVSFNLIRLQQIIEAYFLTPSLVLLKQLHQTLLLLRHGFWLFKDELNDDWLALRKEISHFLTLFSWVNNAKNLQELLARNKSYRKKLEYSDQIIQQLKLEKRLLPNSNDVYRLIQSPRFNKMQLIMLKLILQADNKDENNDVALSKNWISKELTQSTLSLNQVMSQLLVFTNEKYLTSKKCVTRFLLTTSWYLTLLPHEQDNDERLLWLDVMNGIEELETLWLLHQQLAEIPHQLPKLTTWLECKIENLTLALDSSRSLALGTG